MGDPAKRTKQPVTTLSKPFVLRERLVKLHIHQEQPWRGDSDPAPDTQVYDAYERVTNRWVYVLQMLGNDVTWIGEYRVDAKGDYYPADMSKAMDKAGKPTKERPDRQPEKEILDPKNRHERLELHHTVNLSWPPSARLSSCSEAVRRSRTSCSTASGERATGRT